MPDEPKSPAIEQVVTPEVPPEPPYDRIHEQYVSGLQKRLELARIQRNVPYDEFDGDDYLTRYQNEDKDANAFVSPRTNASDSNFTTGTIRAKMLSLLAIINNFNFEPELQAYDEQDVEISEMGTAMGVVLEKCSELDEDLEKRLQRQYVLLAHGTAFVEEEWRCEYRSKKTPNKKWDGQAVGFKIQERLEKTFDGPSRRVLYGPSVFLGSMRQYFVNRQPYLFTVEEISFEEAESLYGDWDMFKYVNRNLKSFSSLTQFNMSMFYNTWRLTQVRENRVEVVKYQDKWSNEYQLILNGVIMLPIGFPLTEVSPSGEYTIVQQNLEPITPDFSYGRSFTSRLRNQTLLLDEMQRLLVLKAQRNFLPPIANLTGRVISAKMFMPGVISYGINPDMIKPMMPKMLDEDSRIELEAIKAIQNSIDMNSIAPQFMGQPNSGDQTATETLELQHQAKQMLGLTLFAVTMLEKKLAWLRVNNVTYNWFDPIDQEVDEVRQVLVNKYRSAVARRPLADGKYGHVRVMPTDNRELFPTEESEKMKVSEKIYAAEEKSHVPNRHLYIDAASVRETPLIWKITVNPQEQPSSERARSMFANMLGQAIQLFGGSVNMEYAKERFADAWHESEQRLFIRGQQPAMNGNLAAAMGGAGAKPQPKQPSPKPAAANEPVVPSTT